VSGASGAASRRRPDDVGFPESRVPAAVPVATGYGFRPETVRSEQASPSSARPDYLPAAAKGRLRGEMGFFPDRRRV